MRSFEIAEPGEWEAAAPATPQPNQWDALLEQVTQGKTVRIPFPDDPEKMRGTRISIGRRATTRGIHIEFRKSGDNLLVQQKGAAEPAEPGTVSDEGAAAPAPRRGRRKKSAADEEPVAAAADPGEIPVEEG